tara:strand:+ start:3198 stop:3893 length:696 start_codon:yes stop_codon:yes gene_type:complete
MQTVHISKLNGKLQDFQAISVNTITNKFCQDMHNTKRDDVICRKCYSFATLESKRFGNNLENALQRNSDLLSKPLDEDCVPFINAAYFRFNAHGELINRVHFENLILIARNNSHCKFALWTKRKDIVNLVKRDLEQEGRRFPNNLILVWSNPIVNDVHFNPPQGFDYVFNNVTYDEADIIYKDRVRGGYAMAINAVADKHYKPCTGQKCKDCLNCYEFHGNPCVIEKVKNR